MTFGIKLCSWLDIMERNLDRFLNIKEKIKVGQISGPIGTYSNINPKIEEFVCEELGLIPAKISTQVIARDYIGEYMQVLAIIGTCIEQFATEIRHLQRSEVLEVEEGFSKNQKGSSAMPHKKNPVSSENLCGLARIIRSNSFAALEDIPLWHERDISHSSVERIVLPDSTILIDYMLNRFKNVVDNLVINKDNMLKNTFLFGGCVYSQRVLLALCRKGLSREEAYKIVQENALSAWNKENGNFKENLLNSQQVRSCLSEKEIKELFSVDDYLKNIDVIYKRFDI
jgi:adenylosuccinate lyase